jgi:hypothetical protein
MCLLPLRERVSSAFQSEILLLFVCRVAERLDLRRVDPGCGVVGWWGFSRVLPKACRV